MTRRPRRTAAWRERKGYFNTGRAGMSSMGISAGWPGLLTVRVRPGDAGSRGPGRSGRAGGARPVERRRLGRKTNRGGGNMDPGGSGWRLSSPSVSVAARGAPGTQPPPPLPHSATSSPPGGDPVKHEKHPSPPRGASPTRSVARAGRAVRHCIRAHRRPRHRDDSLFSGLDERRRKRELVSGVRLRGGVRRVADGPAGGGRLDGARSARGDPGGAPRVRRLAGRRRPGPGVRRSDAPAGRNPARIRDFDRRGVAQSGRAPGSGSGGRRFKSCRPDAVER